MAKYAGLIVALSLALAPAAVSALEIQKYPLPEGGQNFVDPDEKQPVLGYSERDMDRSTRSQPRSGFNFSMSGGNNSTGYNPDFIPGWNVPRQFGPSVDPQTGDRYPGR
jgi:hypothetical protein